MFFRFLDVTAECEANFWSALTCQRFGSVATCRGRGFAKLKDPWRQAATD